MMLFYLLFVVFAFIVDTPQQILEGLVRIMTCRSVLITDYMVSLYTFSPSEDKYPTRIRHDMRL